MTELAFLMIELQDTSGQCLESVVERFVMPLLHFAQYQYIVWNVFNTRHYSNHTTQSLLKYLGSWGYAEVQTLVSVDSIMSIECGDRAALVI